MKFPKWFYQVQQSKLRRTRSIWETQTADRMRGATGPRRSSTTQARVAEPEEFNAIECVNDCAEW